MSIFINLISLYDFIPFIALFIVLIVSFHVIFLELAQRYRRRQQLLEMVYMQVPSWTVVM